MFNYQKNNIILKIIIRKLKKIFTISSINVFLKIFYPFLMGAKEA
ncbi:hypothetical Protein psc1_01140 [Candidatus Phytoplasma solani]